MRRNVPRLRGRKPRLRLRLYVAGDAPNSVRAITNARAICDAHYAPGYVLEIIDLMTEPLRALSDAIIVTPTLLRLSPLPVRRIIGNLGDTQQVLLSLGPR